MKKTIFFFSLAAVFLCWNLSTAQIPQWESIKTLQLAANDLIPESAYSDGYGQHVMAYRGANKRHFLLANDGAVIFSNLQLNVVGASAISGDAGKLCVVAVNRTPPNDRILLRRSTDEGNSWMTLGDYSPLLGSMDRIDVHEDLRGVHIVWDNNDTKKVYYVRYDNSRDQYFGFKDVTDLGGGGAFPKITTTQTQAIASFVSTHLTENVGSSRQMTFGDPDVWDSFYRQAQPPSGRTFVNQHVVLVGDTLHALLHSRLVGGASFNSYTTKRHVSDLAWQNTIFLRTGGLGEEDQTKREMVAFGDSVSAVVMETLGFTIAHSAYRKNSGWETPSVISQSGNWWFPTVSASRTGAYVFWTAFTYSPSHMVRKVFPLQGTITENMFWTGNNWLTGTVTIQSGKTVTVKTGSTTNVSANAQIVVSVGANLIIEPGATMKFSSGAKIVAEGNLIAQGTTAQPIVLRNDIAANQWGGVEAPGNFTSPTVTLSYVNVSGTSGAGIHIGNTVNFTMQNSSVGGGTIGVEIVPGNSPGFPPPILLTKNTITGANNGFYLYSSSNVTMEENTLIGTGGGSGIACFGSSPTVLRNDIRGFKYGLYCATGSSPMLEKGSTGGNNLITENTYGVYVTGGSSPNLGTIADPFDDGGQNSIFANNAYDVVISGDDITVMAQNNWWGTPGDPSSQFQINGNSSEVVYYPWLAEDPNPGSSLTGRKIFGGDKIVAQGAGSDPIEIPSLMKQAMRERKRGNYAQATALLKAIVASGAMPQFAKHWALSQLLGVAQRMNRPNLPAYLSSISQREFVRRAKSLLPLSHWSEGSTREAMSAFDANIARYPNSEVACTALYGKFIHALYNAGDAEDAQMLLNRLQSEYPQSAEAEFAERQMRNYVGTNLPAGPTGMSKAVAGQGQAHPPTEFALEQNYPNPFNPTTTIRFAIPQNEHVTLKVYDLLGRAVATLVDEPRKAGSYDETIDASRLASSVYVYRITAGNFSASKRLLLLK